MIKSIRVGPFDYKVRAMTEHERIDLDALGHIDLLRHVIIISKNLSPQGQFEALYHEVTHAVHNVANITDQTTEEEAVTRATPVWLTVWRDNPKFLKRMNKYAKASR